MSRQEQGVALQGGGLHLQFPGTREEGLYKEGIFTFNVQVRGRRRGLQGRGLQLLGRSKEGLYKEGVFTFNVKVGGWRGSQVTREMSSPLMSRQEGGGAIQGGGLLLQCPGRREEGLYKEGVFTFNVKIIGRNGSIRKGSSPSMSRYKGGGALQGGGLLLQYQGRREEWL